MAPIQLVEVALTRSVIGAFFEVYNTLGFGFLERLYVRALERELLARGHQVARQVEIRILYKGEELGTQRLDLVVDNKLIVETKSTYELHRAAGCVPSLVDIRAVPPDAKTSRGVSDGCRKLRS